MTDQLLTRDVAAYAGLRTDTIRKYRVRGVFPEPDGHTFGHPWWHRETIERWLARRKKHTGG